MQNQPRLGKPTAPFKTDGNVGFEFSFAFQPIVDARNREIISFEALVRGPHGEPSASVFAQVPRYDFPRFDDPALAMLNQVIDDNKGMVGVVGVEASTSGGYTFARIDSILP